MQTYSSLGITLQYRTSGLSFPNQQARDDYKKATWPKCPDETYLCIHTITPKVIRITVGKKPWHGNNLAQKVSKITRSKSPNKKSTQLAKIRNQYSLPTKKIAASVKRKTEKIFSDELSDDGFIFSSVPRVRKCINTILEEIGLVRHPHANRELWVSSDKPETSINWHDYRP